MAQYDIQSALQEGYDPMEIARYLKAQGLLTPENHYQLLRANAGPSSAGLPITSVNPSAPPTTNIPTVPRDVLMPQPVNKLLDWADEQNAKFPGLGGQPVFNPAQELASGIPIPTTKGEAIGMAAAMVPPAKYAKAAQKFVKAGAALLEGGMPETLSITNAAGRAVRGFLATEGKTEKFYPAVDQLAQRAAQSGISDADKAVEAAAKDLRWRDWERPAVEASRGGLVRSTGEQSKLERLRNTPAAVQQHIEEARNLLSVPVEPWVPKDYGIFDRSLIKDALYGWPGVEQTQFPRKVAPRADMSYVDQIYQDPANRELIKGQIERGLPLGGESFYASLYPVKAEAVSAGIAPEVFDEWAHATAQGSARNSLFNENAVGNFLRGLSKRGVELTSENVRRAMQEFKGRYDVGLPLMPVHQEGVARLLEQGITPQNALTQGLTESYKIPTYALQKSGNFGKSWVGDVHEAAGETLGTKHYPYFAEAGGFTGNEYGPAERNMQQIANELDIPLGMAQAGRWFGGGELTGLRSPRGDALEQLEKQAAYTLGRQGKDTDPVSVRNYVLDLIRSGGELAPWFRQEEMPDYRHPR